MFYCVTQFFIFFFCYYVRNILVHINITRMNFTTPFAIFNTSYLPTYHFLITIGKSHRLL